MQRQNALWHCGKLAHRPKSTGGGWKLVCVYMEISVLMLVEYSVFGKSGCGWVSDNIKKVKINQSCGWFTLKLLDYVGLCILPFMLSVLPGGLPFSFASWQFSELRF